LWLAVTWLLGIFWFYVDETPWPITLLELTTFLSLVLVCLTPTQLLKHPSLKKLWKGVGVVCILGVVASFVNRLLTG